MTGPFTLQLQAFAKKAEDRANDVVGEVVAHVVQNVDRLSPVGDPTLWKSPAPKGYIGGHFRANWRLGVGETIGGIRDKVDPSGRDTVAANIAVIPEQAAGKVYYFSNPLPYGPKLEQGYSRQAPAGMVGLTVTQFQDIVDDAVAGAQ